MFVDCAHDDDLEAWQPVGSVVSRIISAERAKRLGKAPAHGPAVVIELAAHRVASDTRPGVLEGTPQRESEKAAASGTMDTAASGRRGRKVAPGGKG